MRAPVAACLLSLACGGAAGPPRGPDYTPANSPEAESVCPSEWDAAKAAREELLESGAAEVREGAARAVLAQAECERRAFEETDPLERATHAAIVSRVAELRAVHRDAANLYNEVIDSYEVPRVAAAARLGLGRLHAAFAALLEEVPDPTDMTDPVERRAWRVELSELVGVFQGRAREALEAAVMAAGALPRDRESRDLRAYACDELYRLLGGPSPSCGGSGAD